MATTTVIRNAEVVVAWDASEKQHTYLTGADVAYSGGTLTFVGRGYDGAADEVLDGAGMMVMPGLVNIHSHPSSEPMNKGLLDEIGSPGLYNSSLYEYMPIFRADAEAVPHCVRVALSELLLSGVTTVADLSMAHPGLARPARGVRAPSLRRADVQVGALVHEERARRGVRVGRGRGREGMAEA
jgi:cytosine/adenosine deaminase-related metal-dependent hydrolase